MATLFANAETGTTGASVANGTSYGGDAFSGVSKGSGTTLTVDATNGKQAHGSKSFRLVPGADTGAVWLGWSGLTASATLALSFYINIDVVPSATTTICQIRSQSDAQTGSININTAGKITIVNQGGTTVFTGTTALTTGTTYRVSILNDATNASGSQGYQFALYQGDSTTALDTYTSSTYVFGSSTTGFSGVRVGKTGSGGTNVPMNLDDIRVTYPATALNAAETASPPPSANAGGAKTAQVGANVTLAGSGSGTGTLSYQWTALSADGGAAATLANANTANATVSPTAGGVLTYQLTVTDAATGLTATDTATVYVPVATVRPLFVVANTGSWATTGAANAAAALADSDATTYSQSPDAPSTAAVQRVRLAPLLTGSGFSLVVDYLMTGTTAGTGTVSLYEGTTLRKQWTLTGSTSATSATLTLSSSELAAIGSLNALDVELAWQV